MAIDWSYFRPTKVNVLLGDSKKAQKELGWKLREGFDQSIDMMVAADLELSKQERDLQDVRYRNVKNHIR